MRTCSSLVKRHSTVMTVALFKLFLCSTSKFLLRPIKCCGHWSNERGTGDPPPQWLGILGIKLNNDQSTIPHSGVKKKKYTVLHLPQMAQELVLNVYFKENTVWHYQLQLVFNKVAFKKTQKPCR